MNFLCGNWKMNQTALEAEHFMNDFLPLMKEADVEGKIKIGVAAPFTALDRLSQLLGLENLLQETDVRLYAQNVHFEESGTFTGEISAKMLKELDVSGVIIGHSERRAQFNETDEMVNKKVKVSLKFGLEPIICVGETIEERQSGQYKEVIERMVKGAFAGLSLIEAGKCIVAYEPVWAISKGSVQEGAQSLVATPDIADEACGIVRETLKSLYGEELAEKAIIQYGGSMSPSNVEELLSKPNINGGLIGGASMKPDMYRDLIVNAKSQVAVLEG